MPIFLDVEIVLVAVSIAATAAFVHGSIGFGFPMIATPLLSIFTDLQTAIVLTLVPTLIMNLFSIVSEGNIGEAFRRYLPLALSAMAGSAAGTQILIMTSSDMFRALLGLVILLYLAAENLNLHIPLVREKPLLAIYIFGGIAGLLGGLTNVMAPVLIVYSLESGHGKTEIVQAANLCFLLGKIVQITMFWFGGFFTVQNLSVSSVITGAAYVAFVAGVLVRKRLNSEIYKKFLKIFLFVIALILFFQCLEG